MFAKIKTAYFFLFSYQRSLFLIGLFGLSLAGCSAGSTEAGAAAEQALERVPLAPMRVRVALVERGAFALSRFATGTLSYRHQAQVRSMAAGMLTYLPLRNGQRVQRGELLARLDDSAQRLALAQAQTAFQEARTELNGLLVEYGGKDGDTLSVSARILEALKVKSGYMRSYHALRQAEYQLSLTRIVAVQSGMVAGLSLKENQFVQVQQELCLLVSDQDMQVVFHLLESEALIAEVGMPLSLAPHAQPNLATRGVIESMNPLVESNGLVRVLASVQSVKQSLLGGMQVRVRLEKNIANQRFVPRSALLEREGRAVVFTLRQGRAHWNEVKVAYENEAQIAISEGLQDTDTVLVEGHETLAHDATVEVLNPKPRQQP